MNKLFYTQNKISQVVLGIVAMFLANSTMADIVTFNFTGRLTVVDSVGGVIGDDLDGYTPISAELTMDTSFVSGGNFNIDGFLGTSTLDITVNDSFYGNPVRIHDVSLSYGGGYIINGDLLADYGSTIDNHIQIEWDATGLANAVLFGLEVGDTLSGNEMSRDTNGDGIADTVVISDLGSATPYADTLDYTSFPDFTSQGPAPMAATSNSIGLTEGAFAGLVVLTDIGSGNSMTVTSISTVPVPAAVWLFGSGLVGLIGLARRKARA